MWVNRQLFDMIVSDNKAQADKLTAWQNTCHVLQTKHDDALAQKAKDDVTIDWLKNRVNALEKQNTVLVQKVTGVAFPTPEIVIARPGSIAGMPNFDTMPSFEDVGDGEASRLGLAHDEAGNLVFDKV